METVIDGVTRVRAALLNGYKEAIESCEPSLGAPASDGHLLASDADGTRSWVPPYTSPTSAEGDLVVRGAEADVALPVGSEGDVLTVAGGIPVWAPGGLINPGVCDARLTLTSAVPVTTSDVTAASTVYLTPYRGHLVALFDGAAWGYHSLAEVHVDLSGLTAGKNYDVFLHDAAGTLTLTLSAAWTGDTTRSDALAYQDGVRVLATDHTRRLVGTFRATGADTTADAGVNSGRPLRLLRNEAHPVLRCCRVYDTTGSWTYTSQVWRILNNNAGNIVPFLAHPDYPIHADVYIASQNSSSSGARKVGIGLDSTSAICTGCTELPVQPAGNAYAATIAHASPAASEGYHYLAPLEWALATGTCTWSGGESNYMEVALWA
jgi:hypothetical protein